MIFQPVNTYLALAVTAIFTGVGLAIGSSIAKYWIEPKLKRWNRSNKRFLKEHQKNIKKLFSSDDK